MSVDIPVFVSRISFARLKDTPRMSFKDLRLSEPILRAIEREGHTTPTPIQAKAIPRILDGHDLMGSAPTGTGKTAAFALPILHRIGESKSPPERSNPKHRPRGCSPRALVVCPTRELATQIFDRFAVYGRYLKLRNAVVFGGVNLPRQARSLSGRIEVMVATPGRLLDMINRGHISLGSVQALVLDEADRMLDMGFIHDIRTIVEMTPQTRQTLLFSATMPKEIRKLSDTILENPVYVDAPQVKTDSAAISQSIYLVEKSNKPQLLERLLSRGDMERTLVFTRTRHGANKVVKRLQHAGIHANAIHGDKTQAARNRALDAFKRNRVPVLVATDVASRGIDVDNISHVVNVDLPDSPETYVHRIGRTGRAGATGCAITFCDREELSGLKAIERHIEMTIERMNDAQDLTLDERDLKKSGGRSKRGGGNSRPPRKSLNRRTPRRSEDNRENSRDGRPEREGRTRSSSQRGSDRQRDDRSGYTDRNSGDTSERRQRRSSSNHGDQNYDREQPKTNEGYDASSETYSSPRKRSDGKAKSKKKSAVKKKQRPGRKERAADKKVESKNEKPKKPKDKKDKKPKKPKKPKKS